VNIDSVMTFTGSLQVSFGKRAGNNIPGTYYICSPDAPASWAGGSFTASLTEQ
jgi:hypothetical protein